MQEQQYRYRCPSHAANLNSMRLNNKWCDVIIKVNGRQFHAHKVVLAANLKYFEAMFSSDSFQESKEGVIIMESLEARDLEAFVSYAYTGEILLTDSNSLNLLKVANYLSEDGIKEACIEFLKKHLKAENACRTYNFAAFIDCLSLKNAATATVISNFKDCSKISDYLEFDYESLADILSGGKAQPVESQQMLFEGIMRWIMHDAKNRKIRTKDLLNSIDITKLTADDLTGYFYRNVVDDDYGIMKDVIFCYHYSTEETKHQVECSEQVLTILGEAHPKNYVQFYNFTEKKWSPRQEILDQQFFSYRAVLNGEFYYISYGDKSHYLQKFNPTTKRSTTLHSSSSILSDATICACSRFVYLCGGFKEPYLSIRSNQVLRYDLQTNSAETLTPMKNRRAHATAIFHQGCLYILGGHDDRRTLNSAEKYDPGTRKWTDLPPMHHPRHRPAVAVLDGKLYACGGCRERNSIEAYDPAKNSWQLVASMNKQRFNFLVIAHEGKLLAIGGDVVNTMKTAEVYDPSEDQWQMDHELTSGLQVKFIRGGFISPSCITDAK